MIGLQMFSSYSSSYMSSAAQSGEAQSAQKPPPKDSTGGAEGSEGSGKRPPPPQGGIKPSGASSGQEMSGRFMMMGAEAGGKPKPSAMVSSQLSEAGIDISDFDAKAFDEAIGEALSGLSEMPDKESMEEIMLNTLDAQGIETEGFDLELPEKNKGDRPPPPMSGMQGSGGSSQNAQQQAVLALFQTSQQMTVTNTMTTSFYA